MPAPENSLSHLFGTRVLVTRPQHQVAPFIVALENAGAQTFLLPCIDIAYRKPETLPSTEKTKAQQSDWWIFTSVNAVIGASKCELFPFTDRRPKIAAIGQATLKALENYDIASDFVPTENSDSESFVNLFSQVISHEANITIVRGDTGRAALYDLLQKRGMSVNYLEVYQRKLPAITNAHASKLFQQSLPCAISITSDLGLQNLLKLIPVTTHEQLFECPLIVNSERCARLAKDTGFRKHIEIAIPPGDQGQILALSRLQQNSKSAPG